MAEGFCPDCDSKVDIGNHPRKGQRATCPSCNAYLEVVALSPVELDWAYDGYDDDDDDFDYDDDEDYDEDFND